MLGKFGMPFAPFLTQAALKKTVLTCLGDQVVAVVAVVVVVVVVVVVGFL